MLPRWHILLGAIFTGVLWYLAPNMGLINLSLVFLASFLIDFDHYIQAARITGSWSLRDALKYHDDQAKIIQRERAKGIRKRGDFHLFHTLEFHALIGFLGIFWSPLFFVFVGMTFHSLLDVIYLANNGYMYRREYFFFNWMARKFA